jgi:predicted nucleic acid-binding protein
MVIVDTTVWIDYLRGVESQEALWLDRELTRQRLGLTDLIFCEVLQGIRDQATFVDARDRLSKLHLYQNGGKEVAIAAAQNYRTLRERGYTIRGTIDCLIATFCLEAGHTVLHRDRDFEVFEKVLGLRVVHA